MGVKLVGSWPCSVCSHSKVADFLSSKMTNLEVQAHPAKNDLLEEVAVFVQPRVNLRGNFQGCIPCRLGLQL